MTTNNSFVKEERLKSSQKIQELLKEGKTISVFPFKVFWSNSTCELQKYPARVAILVPKKKFRRAVDRNLMKRRIREAYRLNKTLIYQPLLDKNEKINLVVLFLSDEFLSFAKLDTGMRDLLSKTADSVI